jgi:hypothetical protein
MVRVKVWSFGKLVSDKTYKGISKKDFDKKMNYELKHPKNAQQRLATKYVKMGLSKYQSLDAKKSRAKKKDVFTKMFGL